ncbi:hypothetical protein BH017_23185 [Salmonella enterica]|nr:hypothetical protein [Salmonella enterica]
MESLLSQIIESERRINFVRILSTTPIGPSRINPKSEMFDPIKAAALMTREGIINEACWLTFLSIHYGKHLKYKWNLVKYTYDIPGSNDVWSWDNVTKNKHAFIQWLSDNYSEFAQNGAFGNHRKYESLNPSRNNWNGAIILSYINWVESFGDHVGLISHYENTYPDRKQRFRVLYKSMNNVLRFGRTAKFDFLTMLEKLNIMDIEADSTYMAEATGPRRGANLLFGGSTSNIYSTTLLENWVSELDSYLNVGMQVMEDSLCNWQKSPERFIRFRG